MADFHDGFSMNSDDGFIEVKAGNGGILLELNFLPNEQSGDSILFQFDEYKEFLVHCARLIGMELKVIQGG